ncbi:hypothetical protein [Geoglobus acetivorans]|uniref:hypothetical protein n=1 Tax=Geoglobus acetivorans TaxID=565033 RepID=UPI003D15C60E
MARGGTFRVFVTNKIPRKFRFWLKYLFIEIREHFDEILEKIKLPKEELEVVLNFLEEQIWSNDRKLRGQDAVEVHTADGDYKIFINLVADHINGDYWWLWKLRKLIVRGGLFYLRSGGKGGVVK